MRVNQVWIDYVRNRLIAHNDETITLFRVAHTYYKVIGCEQLQICNKKADGELNVQLSLEIITYCNCKDGFRLTMGCVRDGVIFNISIDYEDIESVS